MNDKKYAAWCQSKNPELKFGQHWAGEGAVLPGTRLGHPMGRLVAVRRSDSGVQIYRVDGTPEEIAELEILKSSWAEVDAIAPGLVQE